MSKSLELVDRSRKTEVENLRKQEYSEASGFCLDLESLNWADSDDQSYVLAVVEDGRLIATMRGEIIASRELLQKKLEWNFEADFVSQLPVLLLSRAATLASHRAEGLNLVLRRWFIELAVALKIRYMIGTFVQDSPRQCSLLKMGYQFYLNELGWQQSSYRSQRPVIVAKLDLKLNLESALKYCDATAGTIGSGIAKEVPGLKLRIVEGL